MNCKYFVDKVEMTNTSSQIEFLVYKNKAIY